MTLRTPFEVNREERELAEARPQREAATSDPSVDQPAPARARSKDGRPVCASLNYSQTRDIEPLAYRFIEPLAYRFEDLPQVLGLGRRTIERERSAGRFPPPDRTVGKALLWVPETLRRWLQGGRP
jgi:hypothetical protein